MTVEQSLDDQFLTAADPYRRELLAHCYRMMGSIHDAEDLLQETMVRAWRGYGKFDGRSSVRTWLHRIATNTCLTALEGRERRPLPTGLGAPSSDPSDELIERREVPWLEPIPDSMVWGDSGWGADDPATVVAARESVRLAFVAALQHLSARQRAVLVLRDVLQWKAAEVAEALGTSTAAVNSLLQRARAQLSEATPNPDALVEPESDDARELLRRYVDGFERYDIDGLVDLFTQDAVWEMPRSSAGTSAAPTSPGSSRRSARRRARATCDCCRRRATASPRSACTCGNRTACTARSNCTSSTSPSAGSPTSRVSSTSTCSRGSGCHRNSDDPRGRRHH